MFQLWKVAQQSDDNLESDSMVLVGGCQFSNFYQFWFLETIYWFWLPKIATKKDIETMLPKTYIIIVIKKYYWKNYLISRIEILVINYRLLVRIS